jgi:hypothetical protein
MLLVPGIPAGLNYKFGSGLPAATKHIEESIYLDQDHYSMISGNARAEKQEISRKGKPT